MDFTLSNARRFYSSMGNPTGVKGLTTARFTQKPLTLSLPRVTLIDFTCQWGTPQEWKGKRCASVRKSSAKGLSACFSSKTGWDGLWWSFKEAEVAYTWNTQTVSFFSWMLQDRIWHKQTKLWWSFWIHSFPIRIVWHWNRLPSSVVEAGSLGRFKNAL